MDGDSKQILGKQVTNVKRVVEVQERIQRKTITDRQVL
jgi:hypothetical protein